MMNVRVLCATTPTKRQLRTPNGPEFRTCNRTAPCLHASERHVWKSPGHAKAFEKWQRSASMYGSRSKNRRTKTSIQRTQSTKEADCGIALEGTKEVAVRDTYYIQEKEHAPAKRIESRGLSYQASEKGHVERCCM
jgi:hypothetical protein